MPKNIIAYLTATSAQLPENESDRLIRLPVTGGDRLVVSYDQNISQQAIWTIPELPDFYQGGNLMLDLLMIVQFTQSGNANIQAQLEAVSSTTNIDLTSQTNYVLTSSSNIPVATNHGQLTFGTINLGSNVSVGSYDYLRVNITRLTPDTASSIVYLLGAILYEEPTNYDLTGFSTVEISELDIGQTSGSNPSVINIGNNGGTGNAIINLIGDNTYTNYGLQIQRNTGANGQSQILSRGTGGIAIQTIEPAPIIFNTNSTDRVNISSNGDVGIGTDSPTELLHVYNGNLRIDNGELKFEDGSGNLLGTVNNGNITGYNNISISNNSNQVIYVNSSGQVGIGTTTPDATLTVMNSDGSPITLMNNTTTTGASLGGINFQNTPNSGTPATRASITSKLTNYTGSTNPGCDILLSTAYDGKIPSTVASITSRGTLNLNATIPPSVGSNQILSEGDLWNDSSQKTLYSYINGIKQSLVGCYYTNSTITTINPNSNQTSIFPPTFIGGRTFNSMPIGKAVCLEFIMNITAQSTADTVQILANLSGNAISNVNMTGLQGLENSGSSIIVKGNIYLSVGSGSFLYCTAIYNPAGFGSRFSTTSNLFPSTFDVLITTSSTVTVVVDFINLKVYN